LEDAYRTIRELAKQKASADKDREDMEERMTCCPAVLVEDDLRLALGDI
jgi:hypothetical protein